MKIGEKPPVPPTSESGATPTTGSAGSPSEAFADRLEPPATPEGAAPAADSGGVESPSWTDPADDRDLVALAGRVDAGELSPDEAVRLVVDRVLDAQLPPGSPPEVRERVRALVEASLESDPLLGSLVKRLGGGS